MNNPIFLISTGRTGTNFFSRLFSEHCENVASYHTTRFTRFLNVLGNMHYFNLISEKRLRLIWKQFKYREINRHSRQYIENNPYYYSYLNIINDLFPEAKFIWITRFPKSFIISHIQWEQQRLQSRIANSLIPFWQPVSYLEQLKSILNYYQRVEYYSKVWARKNIFILSSLGESPNFRRIKFEDVFNPNIGLSTIMNLMSWLELPATKPITSEVLERKLNKSRNAGNFWDEKCENLMKHYCKTMMGTLGYSGV